MSTFDDLSKRAVAQITKTLREEHGDLSYTALMVKARECFDQHCRTSRDIITSLHRASKHGAPPVSGRARSHWPRKATGATAELFRGQPGAPSTVKKRVRGSSASVSTTSDERCVRLFTREGVGERTARALIAEFHAEAIKLAT